MLFIFQGATSHREGSHGVDVGMVDEPSRWWIELGLAATCLGSRLSGNFHHAQLQSDPNQANGCLVRMRRLLTAESLVGP
jgi:hypothetical protein